MPNITGPGLTFPTVAFPGTPSGAPTGIATEVSASRLLGRYSTLVKAGKVYHASAIITTPVIFTTADQLGPILWNRPGSKIDAHILAVTVGGPTVTSTGAIAGAIGWVQNVQPTEPFLTSDATVAGTALIPTNVSSGGGPSQLGAVMAGAAAAPITVSILPTPIFLPLAGFTDVGGLVVVTPGCAGYVCASATMSSGVFTLGVVWAELPN